MIEEKEEMKEIIGGYNWEKIREQQRIAMKEKRMELRKMIYEDI